MLTGFRVEGYRVIGFGAWVQALRSKLLKGGCRSDYFAEWFRAHQGDTWSLDYSLYGWFPKIKGTF